VQATAAVAPAVVVVIANVNTVPAGNLSSMVLLVTSHAVAIGPNSAHQVVVPPAARTRAAP